MMVSQFVKLLRITCLVGMMVLGFYTSHGQTSVIRVGLNDRMTESSVLISPHAGSYLVKDGAGTTVYQCRTDDVVAVQAVGDSIVVRGVYGMDIRTNAMTLVGSGVRPAFILKLSRDGKETRYRGDLTITSVAGKLTLVNTVDLDTYVSRVVQSEVGNSAVESYYPVQSILCRTFAMGHLKRHEAQGFDVCDHQHCQVYEGKKEPNEAIVKATAATSGIVLADTSFRPILAAYHSNCGGQTANSQDVWVESRSYLVSVSDTFCLKERSATWVDSIAVADLKKFVGTEVDSLVTEGFRWTQSTRQSKLMVENKVFKVADVRRNFKLKSAFFDMEVKGDVALFKGKGFGHGVGLCQQGAMKMAQKGFTFSEILGHYYSGVSLVNISQLR